MRQAGYDDHVVPGLVISAYGGGMSSESATSTSNSGVSGTPGTPGPSGFSDTVTCDFCGLTRDPSATLTWSVAVENGRRKRFCDNCSRTHLRAMEGKLDSEFW